MSNRKKNIHNIFMYVLTYLDFRFLEKIFLFHKCNRIKSIHEFIGTLLQKYYLIMKMIGIFCMAEGQMSIRSPSSDFSF